MAFLIHRFFTPKACNEYSVMLFSIRYSYKKTGTPAQFVRTGAKHVLQRTRNSFQIPILISISAQYSRIRENPLQAIA
jgi:hypothetical protein